MQYEKNKIMRGAHQALYKYLPGSWVDFNTSGDFGYSVKVDTWNSVQLTDINSKRLLRVVNQRVNAFRNSSPDGPLSVVGFPKVINENSCVVLTPKISDQIGAVRISVNPLLFVCNSCGKVKQYRDYIDFKQNERKRCECGSHYKQLTMIGFCKCGYATGFSPFCQNKEHGRKFIVRRGSGLDFVCSKCGKNASIQRICPECREKLSIQPARAMSLYFPFTLSLIDLLDIRKDTFLENEENNRGEKVVIAQYLKLISQEEYLETLNRGFVVQNSEIEIELQKEAERYRALGVDEFTIELILNDKRNSNPNRNILEAIDKVDQGLSIESPDDIKPIAEEILEYNELVNSKVILTLNDAELDAKVVNDGIKPDYIGIAKELGFSNVQLCSSVPIVFSAYGYTRKEKECTRGARLNGFPQEMTMKNNIYAIRLETEGVLFELDRSNLLNWMLTNQLIQKNDLPQDMSDYGLRMWFLDRVKLRRIYPFTAIEENDSLGKITKTVYTLIHSISHLLINEASEICGLDKSSLSEYILPNIPAVFVYCSNSQGFNMGALHSTFQTHFDRWMKLTKERSKKCIFDPICIDKEKACAGCMFLNEVSCQHFNKDLDRSYLCGYFDKQKQEKFIGFWEN